MYKGPAFFWNAAVLFELSVLELILAHCTTGLLWSWGDGTCSRLHVSLLLAFVRAMWVAVSKIACSTAYITVMWMQDGAVSVASLCIAHIVTFHKLHLFSILSAKATPLFTSCRHEQKITVCGNPSILGHVYCRKSFAPWDICSL
jgi:hypothetical protein